MSGSDCVMCCMCRSTLLGSVLRIDVDEYNSTHGYSVPSCNPFVGILNVRPEIYSYGVRNPWRCSFDRGDSTNGELVDREIDRQTDRPDRQTDRQTGRQTDRQTDRLPPAAATLFSLSRLIALPKSNGDIRPIAVGEVLRRLTARAICQQKKEVFSRFFSPIQHGVATECGTELITHHIELLLEHNLDGVMLKTAVKNAFNFISRQQIMKQVVKSFPDIYNHVVQMYEKVSPLVFMLDSTPVIIASTEGVHQGDPLGPILFVSVIHSDLINLQEEHSKVCFLVYLDDAYACLHHGPSF